MQHVLRCWERQSDVSEYKKTLRRPGLRPGPRWGSLQRSHKRPSWWGWAGCPLPKNSTPTLGPSGLASSTPTPKLVPTPMLMKVINKISDRSRSDLPKQRGSRVLFFNDNLGKWPSKSYKTPPRLWLAGNRSTSVSRHITTRFAKSEWDRWPGEVWRSCSAFPHLGFWVSCWAVTILAPLDPGGTVITGGPSLFPSPPPSPPSPYK